MFARKLQQVESANRAGRLSRRELAYRRQDVIDAAKALFLERGYAAVSIEEIAVRAGVAAYVPARYFGGKRVLLFRLIADLEGEILKSLSTPVGEQGADLGTVVGRMAHVLLGAHCRDLQRLHALGPSVGRDFQSPWRLRLAEYLAGDCEASVHLAGRWGPQAVIGYLFDLLALWDRHGLSVASDCDPQRLAEAVSLHVVLMDGASPPQKMMAR
jgi:AcrR family transcriptional regulator